MSRISPEKEISYISKVIEKNIFYYDSCLKDKGFLSENILSQLRNLVEDVAILLNNKLNNLNLDTHYDNIHGSFDAIKGKKDYKFLCDFYEYLKGTASHYTPSEDGAERLVKYYFRYICLIKKLLKEEFDIEIINNIDLFPIYDDKSMKENYDIICNKVKNVDNEKKKLIKGKFYVEKCTTIYSKGDIYYELTLSKASDFNNKFERLTFYSKQYIPDNYSVNITSVDDIVDLNVGTVKIKILISYKVAIRVCELQNLFKIFGETKNFGDTYREYRNLMDYLTNNESTIKEILCLDNVNFSDTLKYIQDGAENHYISLMLNKMRNIVKNNKSGCNIIRYLTTKMVNTVIRDQLSDNQHPYLSNLYLHKKSGMFDAMPYAMSLHNHNPNFYDLLKAIDINDRDDELLASYIKNNTENKYQLYTPIDEIGYFDNIPHLVELYNSKIKSKLKNDNSLLVLDNNFLYINEYEKNSINIIKKLDEYASSIDSSLTSVIDFYMELIYDNSVSEDKEKILKDIFKKGSIAFIYGPAGTGKTKMIELLSEAFDNYNKCLISQTNTAVANLNSRLQQDEKLKIMTVSNFIKNYKEACDLLIIDESSMVSNIDMLNILDKSHYKAIVMVGDIYQIESIKYGNWFQICSRYFKKGISYELEMTHRTSDKDLLDFWNCVRKNDNRAISIMSNKEYSEELSKDVFKKTTEEEIILCLNYDGMYGINNINRVMQGSNPNEEHNFGVDIFKVDDPVLFNNCPRFNGFLHNNLKGIIKNIEDGENCIYFSIEVGRNVINTPFIPGDVELINSDKADKIIIKFKVNEFRDRDDDENQYDHIIPFNLSYAISIHKAQGLEYDSVKIVITQNIEDRITKNIFYTAITRAKKFLKIYWSSDSQEKIFDSFSEKESKRDLGILNQKIKNS